MTDQTSRTVRTSLAHLTMIDASPLDLIDAAAAGGFDAIGPRIAAPQPGDVLAHPVIGNAPLIRELEARLAATGVQVWDIEVVWLAAHTIVADLAPMLELGQRLGARHLLVCGNDPEQGRLEANLAALAQLAGTFGLGVVFEFMPFVATKTLAEAVQTLVRIKQPNARLLIDALHLFRSGGSVSDLAALDKALCPYVHLCDARGPTPAGSDALRAEARGGRYCPGLGDLPLADFLCAFPSGTPVAVEAPCADYTHLSFVERGRIAGAATRALLSAIPRYRLS